MDMNIHRVTGFEIQDTEEARMVDGEEATWRKIIVYSENGDFELCMFGKPDDLKTIEEIAEERKREVDQWLSDEKSRRK